MKVKCKYCGCRKSSADGRCYQCGASLDYSLSNAGASSASRQIVASTPKTVEELKKFCSDRGMPLDKMRFFIDRDYKEPRAFGIYKDETTGSYVVYKNKDDGTRAIRYNGQSESYAVSELYNKLLDECHRRNIYPETSDGKRHAVKQTKTVSRRRKVRFFKRNAFVVAASYTGTVFAIGGISMLGGGWKTLIIASLAAAIFVSLFLYILRQKRSNSFLVRQNVNFAVSCVVISLLIGLLFAIPKFRHPNGYYSYNDNVYYMQGYSYYQFNSETNKWSHAYISGIGKDWYLGKSYEDCHAVPSSYRFEDTNFYSSATGSDSNTDTYSSDSSYDSWDSGDTDWSSDW